VKALLIVFVMVEGGVFIQPMPTMEGCLEAKTAIEKERYLSGRRERAVSVVCAENK
jgi:hypothetical protein